MNTWFGAAGLWYRAERRCTRHSSVRYFTAKKEVSPSGSALTLRRVVQQLQAWCSLPTGQSKKRTMQKEPSSLVPLHWFGFGYAALVASGWIINYAKAGSVPSLAAGLFFGGLAGLDAYQLSQDPRNIWVFLATSGTLAGIMGMRFYHYLWKIYACRLNCGCKFADGRQTWN